MLFGCQRFAPGPFKPVCQAFVLQLLVAQHRQGTQGFGSGFTAAGGHHGGLIPATDGAQVLQVVQPFKMLFQ